MLNNSAVEYFKQWDSKLAKKQYSYYAYLSLSNYVAKYHSIYSLFDFFKKIENEYNISTQEHLKIYSFYDAIAPYNLGHIYLTRKELLNVSILSIDLFGTLDISYDLIPNFLFFLSQLNQKVATREENKILEMYEHKIKAIINNFNQEQFFKSSDRDTLLEFKKNLLFANKNKLIEEKNRAYNNQIVLSNTINDPNFFKIYQDSYELQNSIHDKQRHIAKNNYEAIDIISLDQLMPQPNYPDHILKFKDFCNNKGNYLIDSYYPHWTKFFPIKKKITGNSQIYHNPNRTSSKTSIKTVSNNQLIKIKPFNYADFLSLEYLKSLEKRLTINWDLEHIVRLLEQNPKELIDQGLVSDFYTVIELWCLIISRYQKEYHNKHKEKTLKIHKWIRGSVLYLGFLILEVNNVNPYVLFQKREENNLFTKTLFTPEVSHTEKNVFFEKKDLFDLKTQLSRFLDLFLNLYKKVIEIQPYPAIADYGDNFIKHQLKDQLRTVASFPHYSLRKIHCLHKNASSVWHWELHNYASQILDGEMRKIFIDYSIKYEFNNIGMSCLFIISSGQKFNYLNLKSQKKANRISSLQKEKILQYHEHLIKLVGETKLNIEQKNKKIFKFLYQVDKSTKQGFLMI